MRRGYSLAVVKVLVVLTCASVLACLAIVGRSARAAEPDKTQGAILTLDGTMWRYYEAWQSEAVKQDDGKIMRCAPRYPSVQASVKLTPAKKVTGSPFPPEDWYKADFDDSRWVRRYGTTVTRYQGSYRSLALICLRGKFQVADPARAADLTLNLTYSGGVVVYVNGQEAKRANLPAGKLAFDTLADDYTGADHKRQLTLAIPAKLLRKGVNVLALELHRSAANADALSRGKEDNRVSAEALTLTAPPGAAGIVPNCSRPKGVQVWNQDAMSDTTFTHYGDPNESIAPIRLRGARNGTYSGEFIISGTEPVTDLKISAGELKAAGGAIIPAAAVQLRYARKVREYWIYDAIGWRVQFDPLDSEAPTQLPVLTIRNNPWAAFQPVWVTLRVPKDARPGEYAGTVTVSARQLKGPLQIPLQIHVSDWTLPEPQQFITHVSMVQSPDSLALQYNVPMWSEEHWKLIDRSFELLGGVGTKDIYLEIARRTHFGNEHSMVRWIKQPGPSAGSSGQSGGYKLDFSIVERYLDTAVKHLGKVPVVCADFLEPGPYQTQGFPYTEFDPATKQLTEATAPKWGTPGSAAFLKPVIEGLEGVLAKRGMKDALCIGMNDGGGAGPHPDTETPYKDVQVAWPAVRFYRVCHMWNLTKNEERPDHPKWGSVALVGGVVGVFWDVDQDPPYYGWRNPEIMLVYPRTDNMDFAGARLAQNSRLPEHRLAAEGSMLTGRRGPGGTARGNIAGQVGSAKFQGLRGFGPLGADFWPVLAGAKESKTIIGRYGDGYNEGGWGTVSFNNVMQSVLAPGKDGPESTARFEMIREGCQEAHARVLVQNALLNNKISGELAAKCKDFCDERNRQLHYISQFWPCTGAQNGDPITPDLIMPMLWEDRSGELYDLAGQVAKATGN